VYRQGGIVQEEVRASFPGRNTNVKHTFTFTQLSQWSQSNCNDSFRRRRKKEEEENKEEEEEKKEEEEEVTIYSNKLSFLDTLSQKFLRHVANCKLFTRLRFNV
jgi:hypothetical protein